MSDEPERGKSLDSWFNFYDYAGFIAPGTVLLLGFLYFIPNLGSFEKGLPETNGFAGLGMFVLIAYVAGHIVEGIAIPFEWIFWKACGGRPTKWIRSGRILTRNQRDRLCEAVTRRFGDNLRLLDKDKEYDAVIRQIRAFVSTGGRSSFTERLNGNYGLSRGIATSSLILIALYGVVWFYFGPMPFGPAIILVIGLFAGVVRMYQSHRVWAMELFAEFLNLEECLPGPGPESDSS
jgi:hypothetical protein